ncbi:unnamed protein product [Rotaria socialis]|uniref:AIG1-type G domain-containing protein n=1 Tax=Rotaria socialis TaxID=392032 RepID=A0A817KM19_9BILA|nr:unnamed protein product [Rotaria socialis]CAF3388791.1 unnamed protein product [Rotaria socialis]CAF3541368.1 unnamed protein product [Rotaria socialis]CAF4372910.1 unnamed protein product [Rotaria socialis]CAF4707718.1 unnamed protein product [Rotaria socialis]
MHARQFPHLAEVDLSKKREHIKAQINEAYQTVSHHKVRKVDHKNVLLIGRTRTGKSTIKKVLVDPTTVADEMKLAAQTRTATIESYIIDDNATVLNIIDTPGLFERGSSEINWQDNKAILKTIETCIAREITKFHLVCFCASFESGVHEEDVKAMKLLIDFLGPDLTNNACLIVTRCESKNEKQRADLKHEIENDTMFKPLAGYFKKGILFSGTLDHDSWNNATDNLYYQFETVVSYREKLIDLLTNNVEPFNVTESNITAYRLAIEEQEKSGTAKSGKCNIA